MSKPSGATALVIAPEPPWPATGGGALRTASLLEYLRTRYRVHLLTWSEDGDALPAPIPAGIEVEVLPLARHSRTRAARAARNLTRYIRGVPPLIDRFSGYERELDGKLRGRSYDLAIVEHFWCAGYAAIVRPHVSRLILDLHNVESTLLSREAQTEPFPVSLIFRRWAKRCRQLEGKQLRSFDTVLVTSANDLQQLPDVAARAVVYPNAIPWSARPELVSRRANELVFSGNLEYHPNLAAVRWFVREVWPGLRARHPELVCRFVGKNEQAIRGLIADDPALTATGPVVSAVEALAESAIAIVPLLSGSGTRLKILEAWAAGLPVVSTTLGAEGLGAIDGVHLLLADTTATFADAVVYLLERPEQQANLGLAGRRLYEQEFTWTAAWTKLSEAGI